MDVGNTHHIATISNVESIRVEENGTRYFVSELD